MIFSNIGEMIIIFISPMFSPAIASAISMLHSRVAPLTTAQALISFLQKYFAIYDAWFLLVQKPNALLLPLSY